MIKPCNIVRNDIDVCDELAESIESGAFFASMDRNEHSAERVRIETTAGACVLKFCPFCGASIVPPYTPNEAP